jgi:excisionase family DNA binding protein
MSTAEDELLTSAQVAAEYQVNIETVRRWAREGQLPTAILTPGGHRRFRRSDVEALLTPGPKVAGE